MLAVLRRAASSRTAAWAWGRALDGVRVLGAEMVALLAELCAPFPRAVAQPPPPSTMLAHCFVRSAAAHSTMLMWVTKPSYSASAVSFSGATCLQKLCSAAPLSSLPAQAPP